MSAVINQAGPFIKIIAIPVKTGICVYRDALRRGMNAAAWPLAAVFAPMLVGFIIYLFVRGGYPNLRCTRCSVYKTMRHVRNAAQGCVLHAKNAAL